MCWRPMGMRASAGSSGSGTRPRSLLALPEANACLAAAVWLVSEVASACLRRIGSQGAALRRCCWPESLFVGG